MRQLPPLDFIHVGLGKCASTYLQQVWTADEAYHVFDATGWVRAVHSKVESSQGQNVHLKLPQRTEAESCILSSEGFTWGWINNPAKQSAVKRTQEASAKMFARAQLSNQVLIMVRDPVDWLRAVHEQSIKEGGHAPYAEFVQTQREICEAVLNLDFIIKAFRVLADNVVVLSADELRRTPEVFWEKYSSCLAAPKPSNETLSRVNKDRVLRNTSLKERVVVLARLNRHSAAAVNCYTSLSEYPQIFGREYAQLRPAVERTWIWMNRRLAEFATDHQLHELSDHLAAPGPEDETFQEVFVDRSLYDSIEARFLKPLETIDTISRETLASYRQSLAAALR